MWIIIVPADPVYKVWPRDQFAPCEITIPDDDLVVNLTSLTYPVQFIDGLGIRAVELTDLQSISLNSDSLEMQQAELTSVLLRQILKSYGDGLPEGFDMTTELTSVLLRQILKSYGDGPPEGFDMTTELTSVLLDSKLITYLNWPVQPEGLQMAQAELTSVSLVTP